MFPLLEVVQACRSLLLPTVKPLAIRICTVKTYQEIHANYLTHHLNAEEIKQPTVYL